MHGDMDNVASLLDSELEGQRSSLAVSPIRLEHLPSLAQEGWIRPVDDWFTRAELSRYSPQALALATVNGRLYAIPGAITPFVFFVRRDALRRLRLPPPRTWAQFESLAAALAEIGRPPVMAAGRGPFRAAFLLALLGSNGVTTGDNDRLLAQANRVAEAYDWLRRLAVERRLLSLDGIIHPRLVDLAVGERDLPVAGFGWLSRFKTLPAGSIRQYLFLPFPRGPSLAPGSKPFLPMKGSGWCMPWSKAPPDETAAVLRAIHSPGALRAVGGADAFPFTALWRRWTVPAVRRRHPFYCQASRLMSQVTAVPPVGLAHIPRLELTFRNALTEGMDGRKWMEEYSGRNSTRAAQGAPPPMRAVLGAIESRLGQARGIGDIARSLGLHPARLRRMLRRELNEEGGAYLQRRRLETARELLIAGRSSVKQIAGQVGYRNASAFTRAYCRHYGHAPSREAERGKGERAVAGGKLGTGLPLPASTERGRQGAAACAPLRARPAVERIQPTGWCHPESLPVYSRLFPALRWQEPAAESSQSLHLAIIAELESGRPPLAISPTRLEDLPLLARGGWIRPLDAWFTPEQLAIYAPQALSLATVDGRLYAIPDDITPFVFFVRRELLRRVKRQPPSTWAEMESLLAALAEIGQTPVMLAGGIRFQTGFVLSLMGSNGVATGDHYGTLTDTRRMAEAYEWIRRLALERRLLSVDEIVQPRSMGTRGFMERATAGFGWLGGWFGTLPAALLRRFVFLPFPRGPSLAPGTSPCIPMKGSGWCIPWNKAPPDDAVAVLRAMHTPAMFRAGGASDQFPFTAVRARWDTRSVRRKYPFYQYASGLIDGMQGVPSTGSAHFARLAMTFRHALADGLDGPGWLEEYSGRGERMRLLRGNPPSLRTVLQTIESRMGEARGIGDIARMLGMHPLQLRRLLRRELNEEGGAFFQRRRLEMARELVVAGRLNIKQIARKVGYRHAADLARAYRKKYGRSPSTENGV